MEQKRCPHRDSLKSTDSSSDGKQDNLSSETSAWQMVHISFTGPFEVPNEDVSKGILLCQDVNSRFVDASVIQWDQRKAPDLLASQIFHTFCRFGFPKFFLHQSVPEPSLVMLKLEDLSTYVNLSRADLRMLLCKRNTLPDISKDVEAFVHEHPDNWHSILPAFILKVNSVDQHHSFQTMYKRNVFPTNDLHRFSHRLNLRKRSRYTCHSCNQSFSNVHSLDRHMKTHSHEESEKEGLSSDDSSNENGGKNEEVRSTRCKKINVKERIAQLNSSESVKKHRIVNDNVLEEPQVETLASSSIYPVKALLDATKSERMRRGKYASYKPEVRNEIAEMAFKEGIPKTCEVFSAKLGFTVSSSTVRNFMKTYNEHPVELRLEVGTFAYQFGIEKCLSKYRNNTKNLKLKLNTIKRYLAEFKKRHPNLPGEDEDDIMFIPSTQSKVAFSKEVKANIGRFAARCGDSEAVRVFSEKLKYPIRERTVSKLRQTWSELNDTHIFHGDEDPEHTTNSNIVYNYSSYSSENVNPVNQKQADSLAQSHCGQNLSDTNQIVMHDQVVRSVTPISLTVVETNLETKSNSRGKARCQTGNETQSGKVYQRGKYKSYDPEMRAMIAKFSLTHSNYETVEHFHKCFGLHLPESTVRGLRDRYLLRMSKSDKSNQGKEEEEEETFDFGPRGRPLVLGKYDDVVKKCVIDLVSSGEKLTSFMVVATAKQVLQQNEPNLLVENGGKVDLNPSWAKSFTRRIKKELKKSEK